MKRALISVWDKSGLEELAGFLHEQGIQMISSGGTAKAIQDLGVPVTPVEDVTGQPSLMDGRLKTLDLRIFGPILFDRDKPEHRADLEKLGQKPIDLVVVNLYPFEEMAAKGLSRDEMVEYIDIGGPSLLRAAAKNHRHIAVLSHPSQYGEFMAHYRQYQGVFPGEILEQYAVEVFRRTGEYDQAIQSYFGDEPGTKLPMELAYHARRHQVLRYGENPHQEAAFYLKPDMSPLWEQIHGKELSFNNYADIETAYRIVAEFSLPSIAIIKHANPCGFAMGENIADAYRHALTTDPVSSFGGIVAANHPIDASAAGAMREIFLECIIAPSFDREALGILKQKKNLRLLIASHEGWERQTRELRTVAGGILAQDPDRSLGEDQWEIVTQRKPTPNELEGMRLGWKIVRFVKSNAIVFGNKDQILGIGAGQMSRVDSVILAGMKAEKAGLSLRDAVMASDAFFPFSDGINEAARLGIRSVIQPGGSVRDGDVTAAADAHQIAMIFTHTRHFRH
ncbi:bifunctional phosphoribosylaminoimidazolecarboxamide formyltransferase/IMP cyclohydrolase [Candidatus Neomarinimicrobiota bacterium]